MYCLIVEFVVMKVILVAIEEIFQIVKIYEYKAGSAEEMGIAKCKNTVKVDTRKGGQTIQIQGAKS